MWRADSPDPSAREGTIMTAPNAPRAALPLSDRELMLYRARSLSANLVRVLETLEALLPLDDAARLELAEIAEEIATWERPLRERVPVEVQQRYYERLIEQTNRKTKRGRP